jgi:hypothetical protein
VRFAHWTRQHAVEAATGRVDQAARTGLAGSPGPPTAKVDIECSAAIAHATRDTINDFFTYYFREVMRFETSSPKFDWMTRILALATGVR